LVGEEKDGAEENDRGSYPAVKHDYDTNANGFREL